MSQSKFIAYFETLTFNEKLTLCKTSSQSLLKIKLRYDKACDACDNYIGIYTGKGKGATLYANREKIAIQYQDQLDMFRTIAELI